MHSKSNALLLIEIENTQLQQYMLTTYVPSENAIAIYSQSFNGMRITDAQPPDADSLPCPDGSWQLFVWLYVGCVCRLAALSKVLFVGAVPESS